MLDRPHSSESLERGSEFRAYGLAQMDQVPQWAALDSELRFETTVVGNVLPFRVNQYVLDNLIDWDRVPEDPMFQLLFPQRGMLTDEHFAKMADALRSEDRDRIQQTARDIRIELNPHPAGQMTANVPRVGNEQLWGCQHKYRETILYFPAAGQTCHAYCTFCFRWAQFVGESDWRMAARQTATLYEYLGVHPEITDLLVTGGDPMVMSAKRLADSLLPILEPEYDHVQSIRIGTKSLTYWPYRFVTDEDADELLWLFEKLVAGGKHVAVMSHFEHYRELQPDIVAEAARRIRDTGAVIRTQSPVLRHINDQSRVWAEMWRQQVSLGMVPYYMFVERDTGARHYFKLPLAKAYEIYRGAIREVSGLGRTARGPAMSAYPGKVEVQGVTEIAGKEVFVLRFLQARQPDRVQRPFFAEYDAHASWWDELRPAFPSDEWAFAE